MPDEITPPRPSDWLIVPGWDKFQHYGDRNPPWIKLYTKLLSNPAYLNLTLAERGLLSSVWIAFASTSGQLTVQQLSKTVRGKYGNRALISLNRAGFLHWSASTPLAPKKEVEKEKEVLKTPTSRSVDKALLDEAINVAADWKGGDSLEFGERLAELERRYKRHLTTTQRDYLWDEVLRRDR